MAELWKIMETSKIFHNYGTIFHNYGPSFVIMEGISTISMAIIVHNYGTV